MNEPDLETLRIIDAAVLARLETQRTSIERLETKGSIILGFVVAAAQIVLVTNVVDRFWKAAALVAYLLAFWYGLLVVRPYKLDFPPDPKGLID